MPAKLGLLRIKNLALVEDLEWQIGPGFTAVTGETGAGKSIIIGGLQLLLGERADKTLIRTGADTCTVEGMFEGPELGQLDPLLEESGVEAGRGELIVKRTFTSTGINRQFINGSPTTLGVLKKLGDELVDLHGPHDHQSLLSAERQLSLLDSYAHNQEALRQFGVAFGKLQTLRDEYAVLNTAETARAQETELLRHQVGEIESANLTPSEEEEIATRYRLGSNSKRVLELAGSITRRLSEADDSILAQLAETQRLLRDLEKIDPDKTTLVEAHAACVVELTEISRVLDRYAEALDLDPAQLAALEERVNLFEALKRKYGGSIADVIAFGEQAAERLRKIEGRDAELERLAREIDGAYHEVERLGRALQKSRNKAAPKLGASIRANLKDLGFRQSEFDVKLSPLSEAGRTGFDTVELLFSPNPGEPLKPLRLIASSGEISRLMLSIKSSLAAQDAIPLLVFDEIDANVGGEIANAVGDKMRKLAQDHQVLCITHLPQVAAAALRQFVVTKEVLQGRTHSRLTEVSGKARQEEIARMLGGRSDSALKHAATLLKPAS
ncbi:MAG TPA: DNA repair protein RecN [Chthoniobacterales bacterium]|nr:DNA repair protein RecN [Chthoniobacterales bacterium]